jgi:hypothetical protein
MDTQRETFTLKDIKQYCTISEHLSFSIDKGSENLYLVLVIYFGDSEKQHKVRYYTKDNHRALKEFIKLLIEQA